MKTLTIDYAEYTELLEKANKTDKEIKEKINDELEVYKEFLDRSFKIDKRNLKKDIQLELWEINHKIEDSTNLFGYVKASSLIKFIEKIIDSYVESDK